MHPVLLCAAQERLDAARKELDSCEHLLQVVVCVCVRACVRARVCPRARLLRASTTGLLYTRALRKWLSCWRVCTDVVESVALTAAPRGAAVNGGTAPLACRSDVTAAGVLLPPASMDAGVAPVGHRDHAMHASNKLGQLQYASKSRRYTARTLLVSRGAAHLGCLVCVWVPSLCLARGSGADAEPSTLAPCALGRRRNAASTASGRQSGCSSAEFHR